MARKQVVPPPPPPPPHARKPAASRFAHPFFNAPPSPVTGARSGGTAQATWEKQKLAPLPPVKGDSVMQLAEIIGQPGTDEIQALGQIRFHAVGDTGHPNGAEQELVAHDMTLDFHPAGGGRNPAFFFHLGDVIYGAHKDERYLDEFYRPYVDYPGKIIAIPGNHDGEVRPVTDPESLKAFRQYFCADTAVIPPIADNVRIFRETMTQPGVYWLLQAPFVDIVGLYSNVAEGSGFLVGEGGDTAQIDWLGKTLKNLAAARKHSPKALIVAAHHPPYSSGGHPSSVQLLQEIDDACHAAGIMPDAVISGHAHNYQRHTRRINFNGTPMEIPFLVAGTGGFGSQTVAEGFGQVIDDTTFDKSLQSYGYLVVTAAPHKLTFDFWDVRATTSNTPFDTASVDLASHRLI